MRDLSLVFLFIFPWFPSIAMAGCDTHLNPNPPAPALQAGYDMNTFTSNFDEESVDINDLRNSGSQWYVGNFFGQQRLGSKEDIAFSASGGVTLSGNGVAIKSAAPVGRGWSGTAFGGGGYFRAVLKIGPRPAKETQDNSWPAFWSMAVEHFAPDAHVNDHWNGQFPGYTHFIEADIFELNYAWVKPWHINQNKYYGTIHEWYGKYRSTCPGEGFCNVSNISASGTSSRNHEIPYPQNSYPTEYHEYALLWVPATDNAKGYARYYLDGKPTGTEVSWTKYDDQPPPPDDENWKFGIFDRQHIVLALNAGGGVPMSVKCVDVWQKSSASNIVH